jgi:hypothetical protein
MEIHRRVAFLYLPYSIPLKDGLIVQNANKPLASEPL